MPIGVKVVKGGALHPLFNANLNQTKLVINLNKLITKKPAHIVAGINRYFRLAVYNSFIL